MTHELKTDSEVFQLIRLGHKNFEIRKNDRDFKPGDTLILRETKHSGLLMEKGAPLEFTGEKITRVVTYILHGPIWGLMDGWCIMAIPK